MAELTRNTDNFIQKSRKIKWNAEAISSGFFEIKNSKYTPNNSVFSIIWVWTITFECEQSHECLSSARCRCYSQCRVLTLYLPIWKLKRTQRILYKLNTAFITYWARSIESGICAKEQAHVFIYLHISIYVLCIYLIIYLLLKTLTKTLGFTSVLISVICRKVEIFENHHLSKLICLKLIEIRARKIYRAIKNENISTKSTMESKLL